MMLRVMKEREKEKEQQQQQSSKCIWVAFQIYIISIEPCEITFPTNDPKLALYSSTNI